MARKSRLIPLCKCERESRKVDYLGIACTVCGGIIADRTYITEPTMRESVYMRAWDLLKERIKGKTGWGKNDLAAAMAECLETALREQP